MDHANMGVTFVGPALSKVKIVDGKKCSKDHAHTDK